MTERQEQVLKTIVEYYVQTANPVGSSVLARQFGVSSATLRAEMAVLEALGYITHPHTSAGRIPTDGGYRYYVQSLGKPSRRLDATARWRRLMQRRISEAGSDEAAVKVATDSLCQLTQNIAFANISSVVYTKGFSQLFSQVEFAEHAAALALLLDNLDIWLADAQPPEGVSVYIGEESRMGRASGCSIIVAGYHLEGSQPRSYLGVIGPTRQSYGNVMHLVESASQTLQGVMV